MSEEAARPAHDLEFDRFEAALFDHEVEASSGRGRRRPVADWGGDELFNHVPRRRGARPSVGTHLRRPGAPNTGSHQLRRGPESLPGLPPASPDRNHSDVDLGADLMAAARDALPRPIVTVYEADAVATPEAAAVVRPARARRRPSRTVDERLGPRPDRIAAWAFALGLLLILLAVGTADAATPPGL